MTAVITDIEKCIAEDILTSGLIDIEENCLSITNVDRYVEAGKHEQHDWEIKSGASRAVIMPIYDDEVYKLPLSDCMFDYCKTEKNIYQLAKEQGLEKALLPIKRVTSASQFPIYTQPLAITLEDILYLDEEDQEKYGMCNPSDIEDSFYFEVAESLWIIECQGEDDDYDALLTFWATMVKEYGVDFTKRLDNFLEQGSLGDLHKANIGFSLNNHLPILIDYGGFSG